MTVRIGSPTRGMLKLTSKRPLLFRVIRGKRRAGEQEMECFVMYRRNVPKETHNAFQTNDPSEPQFEGVIFSDGSVAIRWCTAKRSTSIWDSFDDMMAIHGHPEYESELVLYPL